MSRKEYLFDNVAFESLLKEIPGKEYSDFIVECGGGHSEISRLW